MSGNEDKAEVIRFMLRLPGKLDDDLKSDAQKNNRSKNGHIVHILEQLTTGPVSNGRIAGSDMEEQSLLKWFRGLPEKQKRAFLEFLGAGVDE